MASYRIVVGVDGSEGGRAALRWAVGEAALKDGVVQAVTAWQWRGVDLPPRGTDHPDVERKRAEQMLAEEIAAVDTSGVVVASEVVEGKAPDVLCAASRDASLLVLGSHGHSRAWHAVLGSVAEECVRNAICPVVVLPVAQEGPTPTAEPAVPE